MLRITIEGEELYNESTNEFSESDPVVLELEHSLLSMSKWESKHQKPFLGPDEKSLSETLDYIEMMITTPEFSPVVISRLSAQNHRDINEYIASPQTATTFGALPKKPGGRSETITSELIYYWMVAFNIPFDCEKWHLNRLFALVRVCNIKNSKPKKMSRNEIAQRNRELNAQRKAQLGTTG